jgi:hypothetical protein
VNLKHVPHPAHVLVKKNKTYGLVGFKNGARSTGAFPGTNVCEVGSGNEVRQFDKIHSIHACICVTA